MALRTYYPSEQLWQLVQETAAQGHLAKNDEAAKSIKALLKTPTYNRDDGWRADFAAQIESYVKAHDPEPPLAAHIAIVNEITQADVIYVLQKSDTIVLKRDKNNYFSYLHTVEPVAPVSVT